MRQSTISSIASNIDQEFDGREATADVLAWYADGPDNDFEGYYPGWQDEDGPAPSWDEPTFEPEPIAAAWWLGYGLGLAGEYPRPPAHYSDREKFHFTAGRLAGFIASEDGRAWYADLETFEDRPADRCEAEVVEAIGAVEARKEGGR